MSNAITLNLQLLKIRETRHANIQRTQTTRSGSFAVLKQAHTHIQTDLCSRKAFVSIVTAHPRVTVKFLVLINVLSAETEGRRRSEVNKGRVGQKEREAAYVSQMRKEKKSFSLSLSLSEE